MIAGSGPDAGPGQMPRRIVYVRGKRGNRNKWHVSSGYYDSSLTALRGVGGSPVDVAICGTQLFGDIERKGEFCDPPGLCSWCRNQPEYERALSVGEGAEGVTK